MLFNLSIPLRDKAVLPLWWKIAYTVLVAIVIPIYFFTHGPVNFLWFSDIAFIVLAVALWTENRLLASMMSVGAILPEIGWMLDFVSLSHFTGMTAYMFGKGDLPYWLRALSLFHLALVPTMILCLYKLGYDRRALKYQTILAWMVLPITFMLADPNDDNINWVFGLNDIQTWMDPRLYLIVWMIVFPLAIFVPTHFVLKKFFLKPRPHHQS